MKFVWQPLFYLRYSVKVKTKTVKLNLWPCCRKSKKSEEKIISSKAIQKLTSLDSHWYHELNDKKSSKSEVKESKSSSRSKQKKKHRGGSRDKSIEKMIDNKNITSSSSEHKKVSYLFKKHSIEWPDCEIRKVFCCICQRFCKRSC